MESSAKKTSMSQIPATDLRSFRAHLARSERILVLLGAGLSASSGLPTFRGAGGLWRSYKATALATPEAFDENPGLVWQFYSYRRHMSLQAKPNPAHLALAEMARKNKNFITISQNVDGLSQRAEHPLEQLHLLHGSLFDIKCAESSCDYIRKDDFTDPIVPALAIPQSGASPDTTGEEASKWMKEAMQQKDAASSKKSKKRSREEEKCSEGGSPKDGAGEDLARKEPAEKESAEEASLDEWPTEEPSEEVSLKEGTAEEAPSKDIDISDARVLIPDLVKKDLPQCPKCTGLLRPGVVWFGEPLPVDTIETVDKWVEAGPIDLILVIGTSAKVWPAAGYIETAREQGARVAVINIDQKDASRSNLSRKDWFFQGDAAILVPELLKNETGDV